MSFVSVPVALIYLLRQGARHVGHLALAVAIIVCINTTHQEKCTYHQSIAMQYDSIGKTRRLPSQLPS